MNYMDRAHLERLRQTFEYNFKITRLYALYLERCPELISSEMVEALTADGTLTKQDAVVAILSEAFGLDMARGGEDRVLIRDYLYPSVRILDTKRYTENPYYKNIKIENVKDGDWELRLETYPAYRAVICDDMQLLPGYLELPPLGFFTEDFHFPAVLEGGNEWMTLTPVDLDTSDEAIAAAHGRVVTFGLGLGYYAYMCSEKKDVESITVIEKSPDVISLFKKHILPQFSNPDKVRIICADAFAYAEKDMPAEKYDVAFVDTWRDASDGLPMYERMKPLEKLSPSTRFIYWIENFIISRRRALIWSEILEKIENNSADAPRSLAEIESLLNP